MLNRTLLAIFGTLVAAPVAAAQDPYEIQVYEYVTVPRGKWNLETHFNHTGKGAMKGQTNLTFELTRGVTDMFELAGYIVTARREGVGPELAGWRVRPRFRLPEDMLPVKFSLAAEVGFPKQVFDENEITLEVRPIFEKGWGRWLVDLNPVIGRALRGPDAAEGWDFEPGARVGYTMNPKVDLSLEYYGSTGLVTDPSPAAQQVHQFYPGADFQLRENVVWNVGIGFGATDVGNTLVYKMRLGWMF